MRKDHEYFMYGALIATLVCVIIMDVLVWRMSKKLNWKPAVMSQDGNVTTVDFASNKKKPMYAKPLFIPQPG
jgi:hypothetical protein